VKIEQDLVKIVPQADWASWSHLLIYHGRRVCQARSPLCQVCDLLPHCPTGPKIIRQRAQEDAAKEVAAVKKKAKGAAKRVSKK
jgi:endonuclease-3